MISGAVFPLVARGGVEPPTFRFSVARLDARRLAMTGDLDSDSLVRPHFASLCQSLPGLLMQLNSATGRRAYRGF